MFFCARRDCCEPDLDAPQKNSLFFKKSCPMQGRKFLVPSRRKFGCKPLNQRQKGALRFAAKKALPANLSWYFSPDIREFGRRDWFAAVGLVSQPARPALTRLFGGRSQPSRSSRRCRPDTLSDLARRKPRGFDAESFAADGSKCKQESERKDLPCRWDAHLQHGRIEIVGERP